jgi:hypothetical protein
VPLSCAASAQPAVRGASVLRGASSSERTPVSNRKLKYSCGIFLSDLVFENVRQRVGCVRLLNLKGVMSIAVEFERFILTANRLHRDILCGIAHRSKLNPSSTLSGGCA